MSVLLLPKHPVAHSEKTILLPTKVYVVCWCCASTNFSQLWVEFHIVWDSMLIGRSGLQMKNNGLEFFRVNSRRNANAWYHLLGLNALQSAQMLIILIMIIKNKSRLQIQVGIQQFRHNSDSSTPFMTMETYQVYIGIPSWLHILARILWVSMWFQFQQGSNFRFRKTKCTT